jgi:hypothetical protein
MPIRPPDPLAPLTARDLRIVLALRQTVAACLDCRISDGFSIDTRRSRYCFGEADYAQRPWLALEICPYLSGSSYEGGIENQRSYRFEHLRVHPYPQFVQLNYETGIHQWGGAYETFYNDSLLDPRMSHLHRVFAEKLNALSGIPDAYRAIASTLAIAAD